MGLVDNLEQMGNVGTKDHEIKGGDYAYELGFPEKTVELIKSHVDAKRYLCFVDKNYFENLSDASKET